MKPRPRSVERRAAELLSAVLYTPLGLAPAQRIPVLGKEGPDIQINELGLAVDVKSRLQVPSSFLLGPKDDIVDYPSFIAVRLVDVYKFLDTFPYHARRIALTQSITVERWMVHMAGWCEGKSYIPILILHKPGMLVGKSSFVFRKVDLKKLYANYTKCKQRHCAAVDQPLAGPIPQHPR
jgi:hypothetical protein